MLYGIYSTIGFTLGIIVLTLATSFLIAYGFIRSDKKSTRIHHHLPLIMAYPIVPITLLNLHSLGRI